MLGAGDSDTDTCTLAGPSDDFAIDESFMAVDKTVCAVPTALMGVDVTLGGAITFACFSDDLPAH